jgi:hypothetical protein
MDEATIGALANLETSTTADRGVVAALTQANARLAKQLKENSNKLWELKALVIQEHSAKRFQSSFKPSTLIYCCTHGFRLGSTPTSLTCKTQKTGHKKRPLGRITWGVVNNELHLG